MVTNKRKDTLNNKFLLVVSLFTLQLLTYSCQENKKDLNESYQVNELYFDKRIDYKIEFPDTVYTDKLYQGIIRYKSLLDTITTSFDDKEKLRYVIFYSTIAEKINPDHADVKKTGKEYGASNNREIFFDDIIFTKPGDYYIDGIIHDFVFIDENKKNKEGEELVRIIENEERAFKKVFVIKNPK